MAGVKAIRALTPQTVSAAMPTIDAARKSGDATLVVSWIATETAAWDPLKPIVETLQESALLLLDRIDRCGWREQVSERLIALADAADADCWLCKDYPAERKRVRWVHAVDFRDQSVVCGKSGTRTLVEREHPGLGSLRTSEWRRQEGGS